MHKRRVWVEPVFTEAKQWHGLRRFRLRGVRNVNMEGVLIATGQNLKRYLAARGWGRRRGPSRGEDIAAGLAAWGQAEPEKLRLLIWDTAPPHQAKHARQAAEQHGVDLAKLPYRAPELNPLADLWRSLKRVVAANRAYATVDELAERALDYLDRLSSGERVRLVLFSGAKPSRRLRDGATDLVGGVRSWFRWLLRPLPRRSVAGCG